MVQHVEVVFVPAFFALASVRRVECRAHVNPVYAVIEKDFEHLAYELAEDRFIVDERTEDREA